MTTWARHDLSRSLTLEERARREAENDWMRIDWDEKHRPEKIDILPMSDVPPSYRHFLPKEGG